MIGTALSHYRILEKLGQGGMGVVCRAEDTTLGLKVAIRMLPDECAADPEEVPSATSVGVSIAVAAEWGITPTSTLAGTGAQWSVKFLCYLTLSSAVQSDTNVRAG